MNIFGFGGGENGKSIEQLSFLNDLYFIRPLLFFSKKELLLALSSFYINDYFIDHIDQKILNKRSEIRNKILPLLNFYRQNIIYRLFYLSVKQKEINTYLKSSIFLLGYFNEYKQSFFLKLNKSLSIENFKINIQKALKILNPKRDQRSSNKIISIIIHSIKSYKNNLLSTSQILHNSL